MISLKTVGHSGQISLGKQFAGKHVLIEEIEKGVWIVKLGEFIPESERWLFTTEVEKNSCRSFRLGEKTPCSGNRFESAREKDSFPYFLKRCLMNVKIDLNVPAFRKRLFALEKEDQLAVLGTLNRFSQLTWEQVYKDRGFRWEAITAKQGPLRTADL